MARPRKRVLKSEIVAGRIRDYIIEKGLKPGDKLPTEGELAELYGVSRVSVREATKALGFLGLVDAAPRRGLTVGNISIERLSKYMGLNFAVGDYPIHELIDTRAILEMGGLPQLAERMATDPDIYRRLNAINDELRRTTHMADWIARDIDFHRELVSSTGISTLAAFNDLIQVFFLKLREDFPKSEWLSGVKAHQDIIDALRDGKPGLAAEHVAAHVGSHRARITKQP